MPKMRVLIATRGDRRSAIARALGVHRARPTVEIDGVDRRTELFRALTTDSWHALIIDHDFDGIDAKETLAAAAEHLLRMGVIILAKPGTVSGAAFAETMSADDLPALAERVLSLKTPEPPASPARIDQETGLPACETLEELLANDGRRPRTGLLSCVAIHAAPTRGTARIVSAAVGDGGTACRWRSGDVLVLRRAESPGEALVWAEGVRGRLAGSAAGVTWFRARELQEVHLNQADLALQLALGRRGENFEGPVCTWQAVVAMRLAERLAKDATTEEPEERRAALLEAIAPTLGPVQREQVTRHSEMVAASARDLAQLLRMPPEECDRTYLAGLFHDIGKVIIPDDLLAKPGALSPLQRRVINRHAEEGARLCEALSIDPEVVRIVRHHHTRFDALEAVPDAAGIIAVADALVTMTTTRPYTPARSMAMALAELRRCRGTIFDPRAVVAAHMLGATVMAAAA